MLHGATVLQGLKNHAWRWRSAGKSGVSIQHSPPWVWVKCCSIDNTAICCYHYNMKADLLQKSRVKLSDNRFADIAIWRVPVSVPGSPHPFKYRLALIVDGVCVMRYDNESGKGDHKHLGEREVPYGFTTLDQLVDDFWADVAQL